MLDSADARANSARVAVITALPKEAAAVKLMLDDVQHVVRNYSGRSVAFDVGSSPGLDGTHSVLVAQLGDIGNNQAGARASVVLALFPRVEHIIMVGIAGAVPDPRRPENHVRLGDIVVSDRSGVVQYDLVKLEADGRTEVRAPPRPPSAALLEAVQRLKQAEEVGQKPWLQHLDRGAALENSARPPEDADALADVIDVVAPTAHPDDPQRVSGQPRVFHGPIASANALLKQPEKRDRLREQLKVKAIEMEGSGVADATWAADRGYLVIRGTCDYCNPQKGDRWQGYAALIAASYLRALLAELPAGKATARRRRFMAVAVIVSALALLIAVAYGLRAPDLHIQELGLFMVIPDDAKPGELTEGRFGVVVDLVNRSGSATYLVDGVAVEGKSISIVPTGGLLGRLTFFDSPPRLVTPVNLPPNARSRVAFEFPEAVTVMSPTFQPPVEIEGEWVLVVDHKRVRLGTTRIMTRGAVRKSKWSALAADQFTPLEPEYVSSNEPKPWPDF